MADDYTHYASISVGGRIHSSAQGNLLGTFSSLPVANAVNNGCVVLYAGTTTGEYTKGRFYVSNGSTWTEYSGNLVIDSSVNAGSTSPVSGGAVSTHVATIKSALDTKDAELATAITKKVAQSDYDTKVGELDSADAALQNRATSLEGRATTLEGEMDTVQADISDLVEGVAAAATKGELSNEVAALNTTIGNAQASLQNQINALRQFNIEIADALPTTGVANTLYLVPAGNTADSDIKAEYLWINNAWEKIGTTAVSITVDSALSTTSVNPVQNKVVKAAIDGLENGKVDRDGDKVLSDNNYTDAEKSKLTGIAAGAQTNVIETIKRNGSALTVDGSKAVDITVPTKVSELSNDSSYVTTTGLADELTKYQPTGDYATGTELDTLQGVVNGKQATITGAATSITGNNLTASRALVSDGNGKVAVSGVTSAELGYVSGVTSSIQSQLNGKQPTGDYALRSEVPAAVTVDSALSSTSTNPVQNKAVYSAINTINQSLSTLEGKVENLEGEVSTAKSYLTINVTSATGNITGRVITATPAEGSADTTATIGSGGSVTMTLNATSQYTVGCDVPEGYYAVESQTITTAAAGLVTNITFTLVRKPVVNVVVTDASNSGYQSGRTIAVTGAESASLTSDSSGGTSHVFSTTGSVTFTMTNVPTGGSCNPQTLIIANDQEYTVTMAITFGYGFAAVDIAISTSDCEDRCTYPATITVNGASVANSCSGYTPASGASTFSMGSWSERSHKILEGIKPVVKNGSSWTDLDTDAGTWGPVSSNADMFTEFPFQWLSITNDGSKIRIIFSDKDEQPDSTFQCYAHAKGCDSYSNDQIESAMSSVNRSTIMASNDNSYFANSFHIGCFQASGSTSGIYSKVSSSALVSTAYNQYFVAANARGTDYDCMSFQQWTYLQALFVLLYRSTNTQVAHSYGYADEDGTSLGNGGLSTTAYGMAGSKSSARNAFFWIHDIWGNIYQFIGGAWNRAGSSSKLYYWLPRQANSRAFDNSSWNSTSNYAKQASLGTDTGLTGSNSGGYIKTVSGTNKGGFCSTSQSGGSATTYFADYGSVGYYSSVAYFPRVGGIYDDAGNAGLFCCSVLYTSTNSSSYVGSRLSYRGGRA